MLQTTPVQQNLLIRTVTSSSTCATRQSLSLHLATATLQLLEVQTWMWLPQCVLAISYHKTQCLLWTNVQPLNCLQCGPVNLLLIVRSLQHNVLRKTWQWNTRMEQTMFNCNTTALTHLLLQFTTSSNVNQTLTHSQAWAIRLAIISIDLFLNSVDALWSSQLRTSTDCAITLQSLKMTWLQFTAAQESWFKAIFLPSTVR